MRVIFSNRAYAGVMAETAEKIRTETGGLFLGVAEGGTWYVVETIDPGPKSIFEVAYFEYDRQYTQHLINKVANLYDEKLTLIGLWHRHPGSMDVFSSTDDGTNAKYARMRQCGAISALVNIDPRFRLTVYHVDQPCRYSRIPYEVGDSLIPEKYMRLKTPERYEQIMQDLLHPQSRTALHRSVSLNSFMDTLKPLFEERKYEKPVEQPVQSDEKVRALLTDAMLNDLLFMSEEAGVEMSVVQQGGRVALVQNAVSGMAKVLFTWSEADETVLFQYGGTHYIYEDGLFEKLYRQAAANLARQTEHEHTTVRSSLLRLIKPDRRGEN